MRTIDIIQKKRNGQVLSQAEIDFFVAGYTNGDIPDYQAAALLMAMYLQGMNATETAQLTSAMAHSGDMMDLSTIAGIKVDKHSTGGVGDKVTLIALPIAAACGIPIAKMSGRALGHTGGTVDKLEAIPGYQTELTVDQFKQQVREQGIALIGQTGNVAPADKKIYALRDTTATVDSIPLIAASIMSKKLASGADAFVLDVKVGNGAFAKDLSFAMALADTMVAIATNNGKKAVAVLTNMDQPLGNHVGNWLELVEVVQVLQNRGPEDLRTISREIGATMLYLADKGDMAACYQQVDAVLASGEALAMFYTLVEAQGGDSRVLKDPSTYPKPAHMTPYLAKTSGYITAMDTTAIGHASGHMGAGRDTMADAIDFNAGLVFHKKTNDPVTAGDVIATLYSKDVTTAATASEMLDQAITIGPVAGRPLTLIY